MSLTHKDVREILDLLDRSEHCDYVEFTVGNVTVRAGSEAAVTAQAQPVALATASVAAPAKTEPALTQTPSSDVVVPENMIAIRSPMGGAFYATPSPDEPPFVSKGDEVAEGDTLCLVEVMKLFNTLKSPAAGKVHQICVENGKPVKLDQVLIIIDPAGA